MLLSCETVSPNTKASLGAGKLSVSLSIEGNSVVVVVVLIGGSRKGPNVLTLDGASSSKNSSS